MKQMTQKGKSLRKDKRGFTGLEAAIVLTAFIVVAAVFSYMVLGAGFFSTEKAKAVVHTGVEQATSSCELAGDVIGEGANTTGDATLDVLQNVTLYIQLTAGENPLDMGTMTITYVDKYIYNSDLTAKGNATALTGAGQWNYSVLSAQGGAPGDSDTMLEKNEKMKLLIWVPSDAGGGTNGGVDTNDWFQIEVKPEQGGTLPVKRTAPGKIDTVMLLH